MKEEINSEKILKTKTGFCHILPDKIVLTCDGIIGNVATMAVGNHITKILIIYSGLSIGLFYFAFDSYWQGEIFQTVLLGLLEIYIIYGVVNSINNSATPIIERGKIKEVKFKKAMVGLTRSRFEVLFEDARGKLKNISLKKSAGIAN
jgi:hypothetical protein